MTNDHPTQEPYVGPRPFEQNDEDSVRFFGRSRETQEIVSLIFGHPLTLVYAQSGAGKTSLINASITPTLKREGFDVLPPTRVGGIVPKGIAIGEIGNIYIFNALLKVERDVNLQSLLAKSLTSYLEERPRTVDEDGRPLPRVMIFDQFEELFTYTPENWREQREGFFLQIMKALETDPLLRIVFVIREDFLAQLDPYARNLSERLRTRYRLERLQEEAALHAITDPLVNTTRSFAPGVAEGLVKELLFTRTTDAAGKMVEIVGQYVEPVQLQVVCVTLWSDLPPETTVITQSQLQDFNVNIALSDFYESAVQSAVNETGVEEKELRDWFGKTLITSMGTRSTVFRGENTTGSIPNQTVDYLEGRHIIRAEFRAGVRWYELTHDRFIEAILTNNKEWFTKRREALGNPLTEPAREWIRLEKDAGSLLRGASLDEMKKWAETHSNELDELEREFLEASQEHYQKELEAKAKSEKRLRALTVGLAAALVVAAIAAFTALNRATYANERANFASTQQAIAEAAADEASTQKARAESAALTAEAEAKAAEEAREDARSGQLSLQAISSLETDPQLGLLLAIEANRVSHTTEADETLRQALQASQTQAILNQQGNVNALAFSSDGTYIITGDSNGVVTLWGVDGTRVGEWGGEAGTASINKIAFSPDGSKFVTGSLDGTVTVWPMQSLVEREQTIPVVPLFGLKTNVTALAFSPNGTEIAGAGADGAVMIWTSDSEGPLVEISGHKAQVNALAFSPSGDRIVTGSSDATAAVWDVESGNKIVTLSGHTLSVNDVGFSPDGAFIATASADTKVLIWDAVTGREVASLTGHTGSVTRLVFAPSSTLFVTVSTDNTARLWNIFDILNNGATTELAVMRGHDDFINTATFSPDGSFLATASADGTARLWNIPSGELQAVLRGHTSSVNAAVFDPQGGLLATASSDNTVRIWDVRGGETQRTFQGHTETVWDIAVSPDGTRMASRGQDGTLLWDFEQLINSDDSQITGENIDAANGFGFGVDFSLEGDLLATSSFDEESDVPGSKVNVIDTGRPMAENPVWSHMLPGEAVFNLAFMPGNDLLAISLGNPEIDTPNSKIHLWDISTDREVGEITTNNAGAAFGLSINADGSLLAMGLYNADLPGGVRIWRLEDVLAGKNEFPAANLSLSEASTVLTVFSPTGNILASGNTDGTVSIWDVTTVLDTGDTSELAVLRGHDELVLGLAFSPDGRLFASSDIRGNIRVWDVDKIIETGGTNAEILRFQGEGDAIYSVAFSPNGNWLVSAGDAAVIQVWPLNINVLINLACRRVSRNLEQSEWETYFGQDLPYKRTCLNLPYHPTALDAMVEQGKELAREDKTEEALEIWDKVRQLDPERDLDTDQLLAGIYLEKGDQYIVNGDYDRALEILRTAVDLDPTLEFDPETALAEKIWDFSGQLIERTKFVEAAEAITKAIELNPDMDAEMAQQLAYVSAATGDYDKAREALRQANRLDPSLKLNTERKLEEILVDIVVKYANQGNYKKAVETLEKAGQTYRDIRREIKLGQTLEDDFETVSGDLWIYDGKAGQTISIQMKDNGSSLDCYLTLIIPSGATRTNDDFDGTDSQIDYALEEDGIYLIVASGYGGDIGAYTLTIAESP